MPPVQHSIVVELEATPESVESILIARFNATLDSDDLELVSLNAAPPALADPPEVANEATLRRTFRARIDHDPSEDGVLRFRCAPSETGAGTTLTIAASNDLKLPYFNGIVTSMLLMHYEKACTFAGEAVAADISGAPEPKRPKSTPLLPPVAYSKEQAIYLATAGFAIAVSTFGQSIVGQYGSPIKKSFDLTDKNFTNMLSVMRAGALVALVAGGLADRFGRRRVILYSLLAMAGANLLSTFAPDAVTLTVLQTLARGFATAAGIVAAVGALEEAPERARAFATTMLALAGGVGFSLNVILLPLSDFAPWAWRGMLFASAATALMIRRIGSHLEESKRYERAAAAPIQRGRFGEIFGPQYRRRFILMALIGFFMNVLSAPSAQLTNTYLTDVHGYSNRFILLFRFATTTAPGFVAIAITGRLLERYGRRPVAMVTLAFGSAVRALFFLSGGPILWFASGLGDAALAIGALAIGTQNIELFPTETRGTSNGLVTLISVMGSVVGLQVAGLLSDPFGNIGRSIALCAAGTFIAAIAVVPFLPETNQRDLDEISPSELETDP